MSAGDRRISSTIDVGFPGNFPRNDETDETSRIMTLSSGSMQMPFSMIKHVASKRPCTWRLCWGVEIWRFGEVNPADTLRQMNETFRFCSFFWNDIRDDMG